MKEKILITSATGKTGFPTTVNLLTAGYPVRILVRSKNKIASELENKGAEVFVGNLSDYTDMSNALKGVKRVYYCYPFIPHLLESTETFIKAAKENNIEAIVNMGQWLAEFDDQKSSYTNEIRAAYKAYENSGLKVIQFTPGFFGDNMLYVTQFAMQLGLMPAMLGSGKCPWISSEDMGLVIATLLKNPEPYFGKRLRPTGPKSITPQEMATALTNATGRKVRYINMPEWLFLKAVFASANEFGFDNYFIAQTRHYFREYKRNKFDIGGTTSVVKDITGKDPDNFETIALGWLENSPYKERTWKNWFNAVKKFNTILFTKALSGAELEKINQ